VLLIATAAVGAGACASRPALVFLADGARPPGDRLVVPIPAGQTGTEAVLGLIDRAHEAGADGISDVAIVIGGCRRAVSAGIVEGTAPPADPSPALERITFETVEPAYRCRVKVQQDIVPADNPNPLDQFAHTGNGQDATLSTAKQCEATPVRRVVTRYRFEQDRGFVPPDWDEVKQATGLTLRAGAPSCDASGGDVIEGRVHHGAGRGPTPAAGEYTDPARTAALVVARSTHAAELARAGLAADAVGEADQALAAWGDGAFVGELDLDRAREVVGAIAGAAYAQIEPDVVAFLARTAPAQADAAWASEVGAAIDRVAARYEQIGARFHHPAAEPWLRAGGRRLAAMHTHTAELLDAVGQARAADQERAEAARLEASSAAPTRPAIGLH